MDISSVLFFKKVKSFLCLNIKHHALKTFEGVEV
jgi:hypothetical protein